MRTIIACFAITAPLALAACDNNSSSANNQGPQRRNQAQSQLGRTAEMGRNLADQIKGRDANIGTAAAMASGGDGLITIPGFAFAPPPAFTPVTPDNSMRLAQLESEDVTVTISQAGGSTQANIERWAAQIVDQNGNTVPPEDTYERTVAGFDATVIETFGAYLEGGMMGTPTRRENFGLVGAVIETPGSSTFIKMTGPADQVDDKLTDFDILLDSIRTN
ncbi:MAG: hypothetical protein AAFR96_10215 [Planctomycetota bacterium]